MPAHPMRAMIIDGIVRDGLTTDYDGCLAPIVADPAQAHRSPGTLSALQLLGAESLAVIVSGRPRVETPEGEPGIETFLRSGTVNRLDPETGLVTAELEPPLGRFDAENLAYALPDERRGRIYVIGNHGADLDPGLVQTPADRELATRLFADMTDQQRDIRARVLAELPLYLDRLSASFPIVYEVNQAKPNQIYFEVKPEGVAVHTRTLAASYPEAADQIRATAANFLAEASDRWGVPLFATAGSEVFEIQVREAKKSAPIRFLHAKFPDKKTTFVGDDLTDINAIMALRPGDAALLVGPRIKAALANHALPSGVDVLELRDSMELAALLTEATTQQSKASKGGARRQTAGFDRTPTPRRQPTQRPGPE